MRRSDTLRIAVAASLLIATAVTIALPVPAVLTDMGTPRSHLTAATLTIGLVIGALAYAGARAGGLRVLTAAAGLLAVLIVLTHCDDAQRPAPSARRVAAAKSPSKAIR